MVGTGFDQPIFSTMGVCVRSDAFIVCDWLVGDNFLLSLVDLESKNFSIESPRLVHLATSCLPLCCWLLLVAVFHQLEHPFHEYFLELCISQEVDTATFFGLLCSFQHKIRKEHDIKIRLKICCSDEYFIFLYILSFFFLGLEMILSNSEPR